MRIDPAKVSTIKNWEPPMNMKGVRSFLGFVNFYHRFIRDHGRIRKPLVHLTKQGVKFEFGPEQEAAFKALKQAMMKEPVLKKWDPVLPIQGRDISYGEVNYGIESMELLAVMHALDEWRAELISLPEFKIITNYEAFKWFAQERTLTSR